MRILQLHSNFIEYEPVEKEVSVAESVERKKTRLEEIVVLFVAVEADDNEELARRAIDDVKSFLEKLKVNKILIYPYAHLASNLAKPSLALKLIREMEGYAREREIEAYRAPFGWNKQFTISIKGHPLAEQSRVYAPEKGLGKEVAITFETKEVVSDALKAEEKLQSEWFVLDSTGRLTEADKFDFSKNENLGKFAKYEMSKVRAVMQVPPHVTLMKRLELADNEPGSDPGNLRFYPKGRLIKSLLEQFVTQKVVEYGGMEVETPIMYDFEHPSLADYLHRFPARQYVVKSDDKDFFLRFSACFGQFLMVHDAQFSYRQLPLRIYELTRYSFRREKSGELVGLRRLRAFTMPDVHAMCADLDQAKREALVRFKLSSDVLMEGLELDRDDYELAIRFTKEFYEKNKEFVLDLVKAFGKPVLAEVWSQKFFYFTLKWEFNFVDNLDKASALSTDQIDVENGERYDINYVDEQGKKQHPIILHCSPSGAIERSLYALLEKAYREQQRGRVPRFPLWLAPTQVRLIPISDQYLGKCEEIANKLQENQVRVDIDERKETVGKRIREAEREWTPYIICIGEKEAESKLLPVRVRELNKIESNELNDLIGHIREIVKDKPFRRLPLPMLLSQRPIFVG
ncbi:MAG: threonyl-tRNA synthetase [Thermoproteota archaeon]|nr:threonyl-tRNA synthetase [Thermoproteota archaeon]